MDKSEIQIFVGLTLLVVMVLVTGVIIYIFQYRKRRILSIKEQAQMRQQHVEELLTTQLRSQQQTMQYIGREIHDNVGQKLTLASLYAKQLQQEGALPGADEKTAAIGRIIDDSLSELRTLSKTLTNPSLVHDDIVTLLKNEAEQVNISGVCFISVEYTGIPVNIPQEKKNALFRLLQEFIQNSLKHASCRRINIVIKKEGGDLFISAEDDGKGFDIASGYEGIGLHNMKRRAAEMKAVYDLRSTLGKGTSLSLHLKLQP